MKTNQSRSLDENAAEPMNNNVKYVDKRKIVYQRQTEEILEKS